MKNHNHTGIPSFAGIPLLDCKGKITGINMFTLSGPLQLFFSRDDVREDLYEAFQAAMVDICAKKANILDGKKVAPVASSSSLVKYAKPTRPIWDLGAKEMDCFFTLFKESVAKRDGVKIRRKWPKFEKGVLVEPPTPIPSFDSTVKRILPSSEYKGST